MPHGAIPFPFGDCRICSDRATGIHYGVATCEGCKGFYKRSLPKGDKYKCYFGGKCVISPQNRNRCKACRFQKCLEQGMAIEAVKMGRIPKIQKDKALEEIAEKQGISDVCHESQMPDSSSSCSLETSHSESWTCGKRKDEDLDDSFVFCDGKLDTAWGLRKTSGNYGNCPHPKKVCVDSDEKEKTGMCVDFTDYSINFGPMTSDLREHHHESAGELAKVPSVHSQQDLPLSSWTPSGPQKLDLFSAQNKSMECGPPVLEAVENHDNRNKIAQLGVSFRENDSCHREHEYVHDTAAADGGHCKGTNSSSTKTNSGGRVNTYSPDVIKVMFHQMIQNEQGNHQDAKEKLLKKLASTCSEETFSSGMKLLQSVVSNDSSFSASTKGLKSNSPALLSFQDSNLSHELQSSEASSLTRSNSFPATVSSDLSFSDTILVSPSSEHVLPSLKMDCSDMFWSESLNSNHPAIEHFNPVSVKQEPWHSSSLGCPSSSIPTVQKNGLVSNGTLYFNSCRMSASHIPVCGSQVQDLTHPKSAFVHNVPDMNQRKSNLTGDFVERGCESNRKEQLCFGVPNSSSSINHDSLIPDLNYHHHAGMHEEKLHDFHNVICKEETKEHVDCRMPFAPHDRSTATCYEPNMAMSHQHQDDSHKSANHDTTFLDYICETSSDDAVTKLDETIKLLQESLRRNLRLDYKRERRDNFLQKMKAGLCTPPEVKNKEELWRILLSSLENTNANIIGFTKEVPGFSKLDLTDQEILLKRAYYDLWMLTSSEFFVGGQSYLSLPNNTFYTRSLMETIIGRDPTRKFHAFAQQFNALGLGDAEVAVLCCIQLTAPGHDQAGLKNPEKIQTLNSYFLDLLVHLISSKHSANCSRVLVDIFRMIPLLVEVSQVQQNLIGSFQITHPPKNDI